MQFASALHQSSFPKFTLFFINTKLTTYKYEECTILVHPNLPRELYQWEDKQDCMVLKPVTLMSTLPKLCLFPVSHVN